MPAPVRTAVDGRLPDDDDDGGDDEDEDGATRNSWRAARAPDRVVAPLGMIVGAASTCVYGMRMESPPIS